MGKNVGTIDRVLRVALGLALIAVGYFAGLQPAWLAFVAYGAGAIAVATAIVGFCPAYRLLGMRTCPIETPKA